ncbi:TetR/AcrR family transcriptional regulator [Mycobacterium sp.]|uniref:TetR/AcrR family transcriptional regulator n=1 Tax=Mycobacterium sp. TaxID=1785 RepID=UPI003D10C667
MSSTDSATDAAQSALQAREKLIIAAGECVDRGGIDRATVGAIAEAAGVHRVTFYRHFADKEAILVEVLKRRMAPVLRRAARKLRPGAPFPDALIDAMADAIREVRAAPELMAIIGLPQTGEPRRSPGTSEPFLRSAVGVAGPYLRRAQDVGLVRGDISVDELMDWLVHICTAELLMEPDLSDMQTRRRLQLFVLPAVRSA